MTVVKGLRISAVIVALLLANQASGATENVAPSDAAIHELIELTQASKLLDNISVQLDTSIQASIKQALAGQQLSSGQQAILDDMRAKMVAVFRDNMRWEQLEPVLVDIYKRTFTQKEIDGMISFYKTDAGKALIVKMPLALQNTMQAMQSHMSAIMPQIQQLQRETIEKLRATKSE